METRLLELKRANVTEGPYGKLSRPSWETLEPLVRDYGEPRKSVWGFCERLHGPSLEALRALVALGTIMRGSKKIRKRLWSPALTSLLRILDT